MICVCTLYRETRAWTGITRFTMRFLKIKKNLLCGEIKCDIFYSRLSGGSAQSDVLPTEKKKKKSIFGKLKKLTKSRSIDDQQDPDNIEFRPIGTVSQVWSCSVCLHRMQ